MTLVFFNISLFVFSICTIYLRAITAAFFAGNFSYFLSLGIIFFYFPTYCSWRFLRCYDIKFVVDYALVCLVLRRRHCVAAILKYGVDEPGDERTTAAAANGRRAGMDISWLLYIQLYCHMSIVGRQQVQAAPQSTELKINS